MSPDGQRGQGRGRGGPSPQGAGPCGQPGGGRYRRAVLEVATLAMIAESTTHGYQLVDQIEAVAGSLVCVDPGSMYRLLRAMEEQGFVASTWQVPEAGPSRRVYQITVQGLEALEIMSASLSQRATAMQKLADRAAQALAEARGREI